MVKLFIPPALLLIACAGAAVIAGNVKSGLKVGDAAGAFNVKDITGPNQGKSLCYR
jgi:hypothetical protein